MHTSKSLMAGLALVCLHIPLLAQDPSALAREWFGRSLDTLSDVQVTTKEFPALGLRATFVKAIDLLTGETLSEGRLASGERADLSALARADAAAKAFNPMAKIAPDLGRAIAASNAQTRLPVGLWLRMDSSDLERLRLQLFGEVMAEDLDHEALERQFGEAVMRSAQATTAPVARYLESIGIAPRYVSTTAPALFIDATADEIAFLAKDPAIDALYLEQSKYEDHNIDANRTHRTDRVHHAGVRGRGVDVAMLENNGVDPACPHLVISGWFNAAVPNPDRHIHGTSGCVASQLVSRLGSAPDVRLYSANAATYSDSNVMAAADWITSQVVIDITNMSYGGQYSGVQQIMDRYYDYQVRFYQDLYVASAGNDGLSADVGSPAQATNVIAVGSFDEQENSNWSDDVMSTFSSAGDPNSGCQKPNIAANGENVDTLGDAANNWLTDGYDGTSFSAPHASGNLANAMSVNSILNTSPPAAMAALMATAWHNIEGATRLSAEDGAGGLHGLALYRTARDRRVTSVTLTPASFTANSYYTYNITLQGGERTRVAIAWMNDANSTFTSSVLDADLDLAIFAGSNAISGTSYGFSSSFNNNYEIVEFTPPTSGVYTVRINDFRFDGTSETVGIAWSQKWRDTSYARLRESTLDEGNVRSGPTHGSTNYQLDFLSASPSATYAIFPSGSQTTGFGFSAENWSPLDIDAWTFLFAQGDPSWVNFIGATNSNGTSTSPVIRLQDIPQLQGLKLFHLGLTLEVGLPDDIKEIGEAFEFVVWPPRNDLGLTDDGSSLQNLPFNFPFFGQTYSQVYVNANGNLTFGSADSDFSESQAEFLADQPRIAACWDDFNPAVTSQFSQPASVGVRVISANERQFVVEWVNVGEFGAPPAPATGPSTGENTIRAILWADGQIEFQYNDCTVSDGLIGISPGGGISAASPINLSSFGQFTSGGAIYEVFTTANPMDLEGGSYWNKVRFVPTTRTGATNYRLELDVE